MDFEDLSPRRSCKPHLLRPLFPAFSPFNPASPLIAPYLRLGDTFSVMSRKVLAMSRSVRFSFSRRNFFSPIPYCENHSSVLLSARRRSSSESGGVSRVGEPSKGFITKPPPAMHPCSDDIKDAPEPKIKKSLSLHLPIEELFDKWIAENGRVYKDAAEKARRFTIFKSNVKRINASNAIHGHTYTLGINNFTDLTFPEAQRIYCGTRLDPQLDAYLARSFPFGRPFKGPSKSTKQGRIATTQGRVHSKRIS